jgi:hypothetical protein
MSRMDRMSKFSKFLFSFLAWIVSYMSYGFCVSRYISRCNRCRLSKKVTPAASEMGGGAHAPPFEDRFSGSLHQNQVHDHPDFRAATIIRPRHRPAYERRCNEFTLGKAEKTAACTAAHIAIRMELKKVPVATGCPSCNRMLHLTISRLAVPKRSNCVEPYELI